LANLSDFLLLLGVKITPVAEALAVEVPAVEVLRAPVAKAEAEVTVLGTDLSSTASLIWKVRVVSTVRLAMSW
jgi:hypothetical protein